MESWSKEFNKLNNDISSFLSRFESLESGYRQVFRLRTSDVLNMLPLKPGAMAVDSLFTSIKPLANMGLDWLTGALRRRRIQPLPNLAGSLGRIGKLSPRLETLFGVTWTRSSSARLRTLCDVQEKFWQRHIDLDIAQASILTKPEQDHTLPPGLRWLTADAFDFDLIFDEFCMRLQTGPTTLDRAATFVDIGHLNLSHGRRDRAIWFFDRALECSSNIELNEEWRHIIAHAHAGRGRVGAASKRLDTLHSEYKQALSISPSKAAILNEYATELLNNNELEDAQSLLEELVDIDPNFAIAWANLAIIYLRRKELDRARDFLKRAIALDASLDEAFFRLAQIEATTGDSAAALAAFERAVELNPEEPNYWRELGQFRFGQSDFAGAPDALANALRRSEELYEDIKFQELRACCAYLNKDYSEADNIIVALKRKSTASAEIFSTHGFTLFEMKKYDEAAEAFRAAFAANPSKSEYMINLAMLYLDIQEPDKALEAVSSVSELLTFSPDAIFVAAHALSALGRHNESIGFYEKAIDRGYSSNGKLYNQAIRLEELEEWELAVRLYELEMRSSGEDHECLANAAVDLVQMGELEKACAYAKRACELAPTDPLNLNTLANIYLSMDNKADAIPLLEEIVKSEAEEHKNLRELAARNLHSLQQAASGSRVIVQRVDHTSPGNSEP
jgi:tetratricopeptide (TPR) repeat protein